MATGTGQVGGLVVRETERFKLLFTNSRPRIPGGKLAPLKLRTTRSLIGERLRALFAVKNKS